MTRILVFGESVAAGFYDEEGGWVHRLSRDLHSFSRKDIGDHYQLYNLGVSGQTSRDILSRIENEIEARLDEEQHEIVIILSAGGNDCMHDSEKQGYRVPVDEFRSNLEEMLDVCREKAEEVYFVGDQPVDPDRIGEATLLPHHSIDPDARHRYFDTAREVCEREDVEVVSISEKVDEREFRSELFDGLHPDTAGHRMIYEIMREFLSRRSSLEVPEW